MHLPTKEPPIGLNGFLKRGGVDMATKKSRGTRDRRKISEMRNLGPACEADLETAGISDAETLIEIGAENAFIQMLLERKKQGRSAKCCNAAYLYALYGAIHDVDWRDLPETKKDEFKAFTAELRESGQFS